ncbi:MAG: beta-hydroxyacyl-ACP dehydratase [candidate division NC10 bacterium]|nr:beta-hydroxyacyl-ACP dehydratase [candidate division NC10 bacterium]
MRFILIDRVLKMEKGKEALLIKNVSNSEDYFSDHFPGSPIMPGSLILEGFEQASHLLIGFSLDFSFSPVLRRISNGKFKRFVRPGDQLQLHVRLVDEGQEAAQVKAKAQVDGKTMAEATLHFTLVDAKEDEEAGRACRRLKEFYELLTADPVKDAWESWSMQGSRRGASDVL